MTLRIIRFIECQLDDNWYFIKGKSGKRENVTSSSWIRIKSKVIGAGIKGAKIGISVSDNHGMTLKFKKGSVIKIDGNLLVYEMTDAL